MNGLQSKVFFNCVWKVGADCVCLLLSYNIISKPRRIMWSGKVFQSDYYLRLAWRCWWIRNSASSHILCWWWMFPQINSLVSTSEHIKQSHLDKICFQVFIKVTNHILIGIKGYFTIRIDWFNSRRRRGELLLHQNHIFSFQTREMPICQLSAGDVLIKDSWNMSWEPGVLSPAGVIPLSYHTQARLDFQLD